MASQSKSKQSKLEDMIVQTEWTEKDTDIVVQSSIYEELGLKPKYELD